MDEDDFNRSSLSWLLAEEKAVSNIKANEPQAVMREKSSEKLILLTHQVHSTQ